MLSTVFFLNLKLDFNHVIDNDIDCIFCSASAGWREVFTSCIPDTKKIELPEEADKEFIFV